MGYLYNTDDFTGQNSVNIPESSEYSNEKKRTKKNKSGKGFFGFIKDIFTGNPEKRAARKDKSGKGFFGFIKDIFTGNPEKRAGRRSARRARRQDNGGTAFGRFLNDLLGNGQQTFKETISGYMPEVETQISLSPIVLVVLVFLGFSLLKSKK